MINLLEKRCNQIENPPPVNTKGDFVKRYIKGEFGNRVPTWYSIDEFLGYSRHYGINPKQLLHLRNRVTGGYTEYNIPAERFIDRINRLMSSRLISTRNMYVSFMAPTHATMIQGELTQSTRHTTLYYSQDILPMRQALFKSGKTVHGVTASQLLRKYMCSNSLDWTLELLKRYKGHVIEFSCYWVKFGTHRNFNTIFWEVRNY